MSKILNKIKVFFYLLKSGKYKDILTILKRRIYSDEKFYLVRKDISNIDNEEKPKSRIDISLRPYEDADHIHFENLIEDDRLLAANIPTCYVAVTKDDIPCFRAWLMEPKDNDKIQAFFVYNFPILKPDEFIIERVQTVEAYRGLYLIVTVNNLLLQKAKELGYRWLFGCIKADNYPSLKGASRSGIYPYKLSITKYRFFTSRFVYVDIPKKLKRKTPWLFPKEAS